MAASETPEALKVRSGLPCVGGDERGTLRHTWLEGRLLDGLKVDRDTWLDAKPGDQLPEVLAGIPAHIGRLQKFLASMVEDFSPAQLVDHGPLAQLEDSVKDMLRRALHDAFVASGAILPFQEDLRLAVQEFSSAAGQLETVWRTGDRERKAAFLSELEAKALALREALALPQGVILP